MDSTNRINSIHKAIQWFYNNKEMRRKKEVADYFGTSQENIEQMITDRNYHILYDRDKLKDNVACILYYETAKSCAIAQLIQEAFNYRMQLKAEMTLYSIAARYFLNFDELCIIDYGAGTGWITFPFAFLGATVMAYELGEMKRIMEERKKIYGFSNLKIVHPYQTPLPWNNKFDIIVCYEVMEHIHDPLSKIVEFNRTLKLGGLLYLTHSFGAITCSQHLKENEKYRGIFHNLVPSLGFSQEFERKGLEKEFPVHIFEKTKTI